MYFGYQGRLYSSKALKLFSLILEIGFLMEEILTRGTNDESLGRKAVPYPALERPEIICWRKIIIFTTKHR